MLIYNEIVTQIEKGKTTLDQVHTQQTAPSNEPPTIETTQQGNIILTEAKHPGLLRLQLSLKEEADRVEYEHLELFHAERTRFRIHQELEERNLLFKPNITLNQPWPDFHGLEIKQQAMIQYYLPFAAALRRNLGLLQNCFRVMLNHPSMRLMEGPPAICHFAPETSTKLSQWVLDQQSCLAGWYCADKPCLTITVGPFGEEENVELFLPKGKQRIFLEEVICPIFLGNSHDWKIEINHNPSEGKWQLSGGKTPSYLGINTKPCS